MNIKLIGTLLGFSLIACPLLYIFVGPALNPEQIHVLNILGIICACSAAFCFIVGELTRNNSQMDKLWSLWPIAYSLRLSCHNNGDVGGTLGDTVSTTFSTSADTLE